MRAYRLLFAVLIALAVGGCDDERLSQPGFTPESHARFFPITDGAHAVECSNCHISQDTFTVFSCTDGCHAPAGRGHDDRKTIDPLHTKVADYTYTQTSCYSCHADGAKLPFDHAGISNQCARCHDEGAPFAALPVPGFTHLPTGPSDCSACHFSTTTWMTGAAPAGLSADASRSLLLDALIPTYAGTSIASLSAQREELPMPMLHASTQIDAAASSACANCHPDAATGVYYPGDLHSSLANLLIAQPTACSDCHAGSMPTGFVGPFATSPARTPPSGEMKHDAVAWANDAPTTTAIVPKECGLCHRAPTKISAGWATGIAGTAPAQYHASLSTAAMPQPSSCLDCHASSRPSAILDSTTAALPTGLEFDHGATAALGDCTTCHASTTNWTGGKFHLAGSAAPTTCLPCHAAERPTSTTGWVSTTYTASPFDYGTNARGVTHGAGQDCASCHRVGQNWSGGQFTHGAGTLSATTCIACHLSQRPTTIVSSFDHATNGNGDCFGCHQATVAAGNYVSLSSWAGGQAYPGSTLIGGNDHFITIIEWALQRSGANMLVTGMTSTSATLYNAMLHVSAALPTELNAGPTNNPDMAKCWHCHTNTNGTVTSFANGLFHSSLTNYSATPGGATAPFPQPTSFCSDCHAHMRPAGIVEKSSSVLLPMDHNAPFKAAVTIGGVSVTNVNGIQCAVCHRNPGVSWADGVFHANVGAAQPQDCTMCHYPLMADAAKSDLSSGTTYAMRHRSAQVTSQNCATCHPSALARGATTPSVATLWQGGQLHPGVPSQPSACVDCHAVSKPATNTASAIVYTFAAGGGTATNGPQWMNHGAADVVGRDCAACHAADARTTGSAWSKSASFHGKVVATACAVCHQANLPSGLSFSTRVTTAGSTTGVPAGTRDQIIHTDVNVTSHDCNFCHTQQGTSTGVGIAGVEWAQALFHANFGAGKPLVMNGTTGRCSNCHMNVKPTAAFPGQDHSGFTNTPGTQDCSSCHSWPGTGTVSAPNWKGASGVPPYISVGGFPVSQPPATTATTQSGIANLPHPTVATGTACTACHATASGGKMAIGYDHASTLINANCNSCHEAGSNLVGTPWNNATTQAAGAGDTRPFTLTSVIARYSGNSKTETAPKHFYPVDCKECHVAPTGIATVTTGTAYNVPGGSTGAWRFPHSQRSMTNPSTCLFCHPNGAPD